MWNYFLGGARARNNGHSARQQVSSLLFVCDDALCVPRKVSPGFLQVKFTRENSAFKTILCDEKNSILKNLIQIGSFLRIIAQNIVHIKKLQGGAKQLLY